MPATHLCAQRMRTYFGPMASELPLRLCVRLDAEMWRGCGGGGGGGGRGTRRDDGGGEEGTGAGGAAGGVRLPTPLRDMLADSVLAYADAAGTLPRPTTATAGHADTRELLPVAPPDQQGQPLCGVGGSGRSREERLGSSSPSSSSSGCVKLSIGAEPEF